MARIAYGMFSNSGNYFLGMRTGDAGKVYDPLAKFEKKDVSAATDYLKSRRIPVTMANILQALESQ
jgi:hypothetical protein